MTWTLRTRRGGGGRELADHLDRRLHFALSRFSSRIARVTVFLEDVNGPRGGVDKACRIVVRLRRGADVVASVEDVEWVAAIDRATTRVGHSVAREIARTRTTRNLPWPAPVREAVGPVEEG